MTKKSKNQPIENAGELIERFGGIRPMAAKIDTPVTTVQGWKKRDVIPGTRRAQIIQAAVDNKISIQDLVADAPAPVSSLPKPKMQSKETKIINPNANQNDAPRVAASAPSERVPTETVKNSPSITASSAKTRDEKASSSHDDILAQMAANNRKNMVASAWITTTLILVAAIVGGFLLWPSVKESKEQIEAQSEKLVELEENVEDVNSRTSIMSKIVPENLQETMDGLQLQARNIQNTVEQLSSQAGEISSGVLGAEAGPLSQRLAVLEEKMAEISGNNTDFGNLISRIKSLEASVGGQAQLTQSVNELRAMVEGNSENSMSLSEDLENAQTQEEGALGQTLEGVSGNDLKAAAMLITFSKLRDSLNRQEPFEEDLALLEKLAGEDNPELQSAIDRLAPHADGGVLSAAGLSQEFKGFAGDIVVSSLKGEDVSFSEKAKARIGNVLRIEKEGELVSGTQTQATVERAQALLDAGNIQGAIAQLQTLDGQAAQTAQPFIQQAQISLLAEKAQQLLGENILSKINQQIPVQGILKNMGMEESFNALSGASPETTTPDAAQNNSIIPQFDMNSVKQTLENAIPLGAPQEVIRDEESGLTILPSQPGFKGFSGGE